MLSKKKIEENNEKKLSFFSISKELCNERLDKIILKYFPDLSFVKIQKLIRTGIFKVNKVKKKAHYKVKYDDKIQFSNFFTSEFRFNNNNTTNKYIKETNFLKKNIIYQDDSILILNKPSGIPVQGGNKINFHLDCVLPYLSNDGKKLKLVHRIDKSTSGLLLLAKTKEAAQKITKLFKLSKVNKKYWALVLGKPLKKEGKIIKSISKKEVEGKEKMVVDENNFKYAETQFRLLSSNNNYSLLEVIPITGRTHQIRVHLKSMRMPILGDYKYNSENIKKNEKKIKLHLHAKEISFKFNEREYFFTAKIPSYFENSLIKKEIKYE